MFPLTSEQWSMRYLERLLGPGVAHNIAARIPVPATADVARVSAALHEIVARQAALRTAIRRDGQELGPAEVDLVSTETTDVEREIGRRSVELHTAELHPRTVAKRARYELIRGDAAQELLVTIDHLVSDGYSVRVLKRELAALLGGEPLAPVPVPFDRLCMELAQERALRRDTEVTYWERAYQDVPALTGLMPHDGGPAMRAQHDVTHLDATAYQRIRRLAARLRTTPFVAVAALVSLVIWRRTGQAAFGFYTPVSTRKDARTGAVAGYFINERPLVCSVDPDRTLAEHARAIGAASTAAVRHSDLSVPDLVARVPSYGYALETGGVDYLQLHVGLRDTRRPLPADSSGDPETLVLGEFRPSRELTCTTLRFDFAPERTFIRSFFGGPPGGLDRAAALSAEVLDLLLRHTDDVNVPLGPLAELSLVP